LIGFLENIFEFFLIFRWLSVPLEVRQYVKECVLKTLGTEVRPSTAAQCVAAISCIEFPIRVYFIL